MFDADELKLHWVSGNPTVNKLFRDILLDGGIIKSSLILIYRKASEPHFTIIFKNFRLSALSIITTSFRNSNKHVSERPNQLCKLLFVQEPFYAGADNIPYS